ncbi:MAG: hypothetical protein IIU07_01975 [Lachnospiraceae bacterium]|nr:hypothetical protein [Lachnospiraceae bacterium]
MRDRFFKCMIPAAAAALWTAASLIYDRRTFETAPIEALHNYIPCKILMFVAVFAFAGFLTKAVLDRSSLSRRVLIFAILYFVPMILVLVYKIPEGFLSNDESLIFAEASRLADYTWFYYITTWYYIVSMMLIPAWTGPIIVKVIIQCLTAGYALARLYRFMEGSRKALLLYAAFILPPILAYTTSAHRIPIYIFLYVLFMYILFMDRLENAPFTWTKALPMLFLMAVLTQWRTEGIYLAVFGPALMIVSYPSIYRKDRVRNTVRLLLLSFLIQYIVAIPQYGLIPSRMEDKAANRMLPFYAYTVTNMYRNGLDTDDPANIDALEKIDRYLNVDTIAAINDHLGDINYEDALILYYQGFDGRRTDADDGDYMAFVEGSKELMQHNPDVLMRTKWGSFDYAATVYDPVLGFGLLSFVISLVKTVAYNLYAPMILLIAFFIYALVKLKKRAWTSVFYVLLSLCLLSHFAIVFILAPASYFKYYFPVYFTTYFFAILLTILRSERKLPVK